MICSLKLGNRIFPVNIIQGPLAGISCAPFRALTWRYSQPAFSCTEMISCKTLLYQPRLAMQRYIKKDPNEGPVSFQLSSNDPHELAQAVKIATDYGADLIDLNCGCPVKKIRQKGAGSSLLMNAAKLYQLIKAMKNNTHIPVSIKIRVEGQLEEKFHHEIIQAIKDGGVDFLVVHGRHWQDNYAIPCRYEAIQFFVENLSIPVIGNGDIACIDSLKKMFATKCAGVMIARFGVGQPWLIRQLIAEMREENFVSPYWAEIKNIFLEHVERLMQLMNDENVAILQARKFAKYYTRQYENKVDFVNRVNQCETFQQLKIICDEFNN